jgi:hypothetical protein
MTMIWVQKHPRATPDMLGYITDFLSDDDPRTAREQIDANYRHGGGFRPFTGMTMLPNGNMQYPGDPDYLLLFETKLRDEIIRFYMHEWLAIIQPDGSFVVCRMD